MRLAAAICVLTACSAAAQDRARAPQTDQTVAAERGGRLAVNNLAGEIVIHSWDKDAVRVQARHSQHMRVVVRNTATGVSVAGAHTGGPQTSIDYDISAPAWMPIKVYGTYTYVMIDGVQSEVSVETVRGDIVVKGATGLVTAKSIEGEVIVDGARGRVNASSVNQGIKITDASGDVTAETTNGSISLGRITAASVEVSTVNGNIVYEGAAADGGRYHFVTHNGDITVSVPETVNATFGVRTYNGDFRSGLPLKGTGEVRRGKRGTYVLGNGSAEVELESFSGTIRVRRSGPENRTRQDRRDQPTQHRSRGRP